FVTRVTRSGSERFTHVCCITEGNDVQMYVNGRLRPTAHTRGRYPALANAVSSIGGSPQTVRSIGGGFLKGQIRSFRISKSVRYADKFFPPVQFENDAETLVLYRLDEGSGDTLKDASGHNHPGRIVGAKWVKPTASTARRAR